ncbi:hypothetical protein AGDE_11195 [Angomonas deanei]|uniref:Uncharacterized protein n=1 Tax=Angomonas deanei TaxID=59799 RepID=A0A7G2CCX0_9TRYP|nr:hypothetical protein AGDE_11195 [Angomonas deanei]CAD2216787.1 hypothetical protein, conserved [Angomonas deanei]|eukprot:EPY26582.1 hypothetical protein AGDE_11195 [Angomonas deanei]
MQDKRDALALLLNKESLPYEVESSTLPLFVQIITSEEDADLCTLSLDLLELLTDLAHYPKDHSGKENQSIRNEFLCVLVGDIQFCIVPLRTSSEPWDKYHAVKLLQRLEEYDEQKVHQQLLSSHALSDIAALLQDDSFKGALRREVVTLLTSLTQMDREVQTLLSFENGFEALFNLIKSVNGVEGGVLVADCLTIMLNLLRGNKSTQKFFREMGLAKHLCPIFQGVADKVATYTDDKSLLSTQASVNLLMCVRLVFFLMKESEDERERDTTRNSLYDAGLLPPFLALSLGGLGVDDGTRIESLRTLSMLLRDSPRGVGEALRSVVYTICEYDGKRKAIKMTVLRALLEYLLRSEDNTLILSTRDLLEAIANETSSQALLVREIASSMNGSYVERKELSESGALLTYALFESATTSRFLCSPRAKYNAAHFLNVLLRNRTTADGLVDLSWLTRKEGNAPATGPATGVAQHVPSGAPLNLFTVFAAYLVYCVKGGHSGEGIDTSTLAAYVRVLFAWTGNSGRALTYFTSETSWFEALIHVAASEAPVHVRLWCACLAAHICLLFPPESDLEPFVKSLNLAVRPKFTKAALISLFADRLGSSDFFENTLMMDIRVSNPQWNAPPASAFRSSAPVVYDEEFVGILKGVMEAFKQVIPSHTPSLPNSPKPIALEEDKSPPQVRKPSVEITDREETLYRPQMADVPASEFGDDIPHFDSPNSHPCTPQTTHVNDILDMHKFDESAANDIHNMDELREKVKDLEDKLMYWKKVADEREEQLRHAAQAYSSEKERGTWGAAGGNNEIEETGAGGYTKEEVEGLRENVRLLEAALSAKEEEQEQLVQSLNTMSWQLKQSEQSSSPGNNATPRLEEALQQVQQELQETRHQLRQREEQVFDLQRQVDQLNDDKEELLIMTGKLDDSLQRALQQRPEGHPSMSSYSTDTQQYPFSAQQGGMETDNSLLVHPDTTVPPNDPMPFTPPQHQNIPPPNTVYDPFAQPTEEVNPPAPQPFAQTIPNHNPFSAAPELGNHDPFAPLTASNDHDPFAPSAELANHQPGLSGDQLFEAVPDIQSGVPPEVDAPPQAAAPPVEPEENFFDTSHEEGYPNHGAESQDNTYNPFADCEDINLR